LYGACGDREGDGKGGTTESFTAQSKTEVKAERRMTRSAVRSQQQKGQPKDHAAKDQATLDNAAIGNILMFALKKHNVEQYHH